MPASVSIKIEKPCSENLSSMNKVGCGFHCQTCNKTVVDFREYSDKALVDFLRKNQQQETCGLFMETQIGRPISIPQPVKLYRNRIKDWLVAASLTYCVATQFGCTRSPKKVAPRQYMTGVVVFENKCPVPFALIDVHLQVDGQYRTQRDTADEFGEFSIKLPQNMTSTQIGIEAYRRNLNNLNHADFSRVGYIEAYAESIVNRDSVPNSIELITSIGAPHGLLGMFTAEPLSRQPPKCKNWINRIFTHQY